MQERFTAYLLAHGCKQVKRLSRYVVFSRMEDDQFYYVGRNGALRLGKTVTCSYPVNDRVKQIMLQWEPPNV